MRQIFLTTNDANLQNGDKVRFRDLGISFTHPTTDFNLSEEESIERMRLSLNLQEQSDAGNIILKDDQGRTITNLAEYLTPQFAGEKEHNDGGRTSELEVSSVDAYSTATVNLTAKADTARYEIKWYAEVSLSKNRKTCECKIVLDGSETIAEFTKTNEKKNKFESISGFIYKDMAAGSHSVSLEVNTDSNGVSVKIRRITIAVEKK